MAPNASALPRPERIGGRTEAPTMPAPPPERFGYRASAWHRGPVAALSLACAGGLVALLAWMNVAVPHRRMHSPLVVMDLAVVPPPPPKPSPPTPRPANAASPPVIVVPPPIVAMPSPPFPVSTVVAPSPPAVTVAPAAPAAPVAPAPPAVVEGGDLSSRLAVAKPPAYPLESRRRHEQGTVVLVLLISTEGAVTDIAVAESSGSTRLDEAALAAVKRWRWLPLVRDGVPVLVRGRVRIPFVLTR